MDQDVDEEVDVNIDRYVGVSKNQREPLFGSP